MAVLAYCITEPEPAVAVPQAGIQERPIRSLMESGLRCFVSDYSDQGPEARQEIRAAALAFNRILQQFLRQTAVIPFRFPTVLRDDLELNAFLREHATEYKDGLARLRGTVQMEVRLVVSTADGDMVPESGTEYLRARQMRYHELEQIGGKVLEQAGAVRARSMKPVTNGMRLFFLVDRSDADKFVARMQSIELPEDITARISGPWPATEFLKGNDGE